MKRQLLWLLIALVAAPGIATAATSLNGTVTAQRSDDPAHLGLWEYTIRFEWELPAGPITALDVYLPLDDCECSCEDNIFRFGNPSGSLLGSQASLPCALELLGTYSCAAAPEGRPRFRFLTLQNDACGTGATGSGVLTVFSLLGPDPEEGVGEISTRSAGVAVNGRLTGTMPLCNGSSCTALPVEARTWSLIKTVYR